MLAALRKKDYYHYEYMKSNGSDAYCAKKYQEACQECVTACARLHAHYTEGNILKGE